MRSSIQPFFLIALASILFGWGVAGASPAYSHEAAATAAPVQIVIVDPVAVDDGSEAGMLLRITAPAGGANLGVVVFSHGDQLSRTAYEPLVAHLARNGYVVVQPDHPDATDFGLTADPARPANGWLTRARQLRWLGANLDTVIDAVPELAGRIDPYRFVVAGHSFGGFSAALAMGASVAEEVSGEVLAAPQYRAAILLAPPGRLSEMTGSWQQRAPYLDADYGTMRGPVLVVTGQEDVSTMSERGAPWREGVWQDAAAGRGICLLRLPGVGHYLGGIDHHLRPPERDATVETRKRLFDNVTAFLDSRASADGGKGFAQESQWHCK